MTPPPGVGQLGIVELTAVCAEQRATALSLFRVLGGWAIDTDDKALQRLFLTACHRHAWHAELWEARTPTIPVASAAAASDTADAPAATGDQARAEAYSATLSQLDATLTELLARVDAELDPSTLRTVTLVQRDARELAGAISGLR